MDVKVIFGFCINLITGKIFWFRCKYRLSKGLKSFWNGGKLDEIIKELCGIQTHFIGGSITISETTKPGFTV